ncbi:ATP-binding protein [Streptomyces gamaensis]|uniref:ATP-binding protein n=1 Tax=Streptomyces gamaensis TaxID=1763542 RepID=A0ABW0Z6Z4_9ACTN
MPHRNKAIRLGRPAQLPADVTDFTGRTALVGELEGRLTQCRNEAPTVLAVAGAGGTGKTSIAVHVGHRVRHRFPDGQLYASLQGAWSLPAEPGDVLGSFLRALGVDGPAIPEATQDRSALYRSLLADREVLVVLDDARDAAQVQPLLPATAGCGVLITSRNRLFDVPNVHLVDLDVMTCEEALDLFAGVCGEERVEAERDAAAAVVQACGLLPLAVRVAACRLAARRAWPVSLLARKLAAEHRRLDELHVGDVAVRAAFDLSYGRLVPQHARAFRLLSLPDGPSLSLGAAAALLDTGMDTAERLLDALVDASLLEAPVPGRYRFHDLLRLYAHDRAEQDETPQERQAAMSRLLDFSLATAIRYHQLLRPGDRLTDPSQPPFVPGLTQPAPGSGLHFEDSASALDWLFTEAPGLLACARQLAGGDTLQRSVDLLTAVSDLSESGIEHGLYRNVATAALEASRREGDIGAEARVHRVLAMNYASDRELERAEEHARTAIALGSAAGDRLVCANASNVLGVITFYRQDFTQARTALTRALETFRAENNALGEAIARANLSRVELEAGHTRDAVELATEALTIVRKAGAARYVSGGLYIRGTALTAAGHHDQAVQDLTEALDLYRTTRQHWWTSRTHRQLARALLAAGHPHQAHHHAEQSLATMPAHSSTHERANALTTLGHTLNEIGQTVQAQEHWREALTLYENLGAQESDAIRQLLANRPDTTSHS